MSEATNLAVSYEPLVAPVQETAVEPQLRRALRRPLDALTSARFFAAFYVVLFHFGTKVVADHGAPVMVCTFVANGWMGVPFFFLLSGFILTYSYSGQLSSMSERRRFWEARFARMYPVYLLSLLVNIPFRGSMSWQTMIAVLTGTQAWNPWKSYLAQAWNFPAWTLSVEAFFYLCFPLVLVGCERLSRRRQLLLGVLVLAIVAFCHTPIPVERITPAWAAALGKLPIPVVRLPEFVVGVLMAQRFLEGRATFHPKRALAYLLTAVLLLSTLRGDWLSLVVIPFAGLLYELASMTREDRGVVRRGLMSARLVFLGGASYSVYLLQYPIRNWVRAGLAPWGSRGNLVGALLSPLLTIIVSCFVFHFYEEPCRRFLKRWFALRERTAESRAA